MNRQVLTVTGSLMLLAAVAAIYLGKPLIAAVFGGCIAAVAAAMAAKKSDDENAG